MKHVNVHVTRLPGFEPFVIFCEVAHMDSQKLSHELRALGYQLGRVRSDMAEDGLGDLVAWKMASTACQELQRALQGRFKVGKGCVGDCLL